MKKYIITLIIALMMVSACGYRMSGLEDFSEKGSFYPNAFVNKTKESDILDTVERSVTTWLSVRRAIASKETATYRMNVTLESVSSSRGIVSDTGDISSADVNGTIRIQLKDVEGKEVFNKTFSSYESYKVETSVSRTKRNWKEAVKRVVNAAMSDFINEF